jgi:phosphoribosylamine---glycine ligase
MKVLVVGGGGREHALAWKLRQSAKVADVYIAPGNAGTALVGTSVSARTSEEILAWITKHAVDLVVVGPDEYLAAGLTDDIRALGIPVFGPSKFAAEIEWSKAYAKQFMEEEGIPTAHSRAFSDADDARAYARTEKLPLVVKADGLAAGKGVIIAKTHEEADDAITTLMQSAAGARVVIEEYLEGYEISVHALCDGTHALLFPPAKDHKRIGENDTGPNTGGMGTIVPVPGVTTNDMNAIRDCIIMPTLKGLEKRGRPFSGLPFPGVMLTETGPKVIEFNARFGDPETQSYLRLLESDLFDVLYASARGSLSGISLVWKRGATCCIVVASEGYPGTYEKGKPVTLPTDSDAVVVFHAGTVAKNGRVVTNGGRVLGVTAIAETLPGALSRAYAVITPKLFEGACWRRDIGAQVYAKQNGVS